MYVVCPACQDAFKISSAHLAVAQGHVRCGGCQAVFDATASIYDSLEEAGDAVQRLRTAEQDLEGVVNVAQSASTAEVDVVAAGIAARLKKNTAKVKNRPAVVTGIDIDFYAQPITSEHTQLLESIQTAEVLILEETEEPVSPTIRVSEKVWWGVAVSVFLSVLLAGQYVWKERNRLAADPQLRPWMESYCAVLRCDLPLRRDVSKIAILDREVRDHPQIKDALLVSATIVNDAPFAQGYPVFEISFSDMSGTAISVRRFEPDEYLSDNIDTAQGFQPGEKTRLTLEVLDPGKQAVSFQLDFL